MDNKAHTSVKKVVFILTIGATIGIGSAGCGSAEVASVSNTASQEAGQAAESGGFEDSTDSAASEGSSSADNTDLGNTSTFEEEEAAFPEEESTTDETASAEAVGSIRTLPSEEELSEASESSSSGTGSSDQSMESSGTSEPLAVYPASVGEIVPAGTITGPSVMFVPNKEVKDITITVRRDDSFPDSQEDVDQILKGLSDYWAAYDLDAVDYLVRMDKFRYLSGTLEGTNDYYYYGETDAEGRPDGTGIAAYADNQYYYGSFSSGQRSGKGYWYQIYVKNGRFYKNNYGIYGHSYNGEWKDNLPDGQGQEHFDADIAELTDGRLVTNMIGTFAGGYYNGDFTVVSVSPGEGEINWEGTCCFGTWVPFSDSIHIGIHGQDEVRVLRNLADEDNYYYMNQDENHGQGVYNLVP